MTATFPAPGRTGGLRSTAGTAASSIALALAAVMLLPGVFGYGRHVITGDSMSEAFPRGSLVYEKRVPTRSLKVGDVITYTPPREAGPHGPVTHRIAWVGRGRGGAPAFRTKGDSNSHADPWRFVLERGTQAKVVLSVPLIGWPFAVLAERWARILTIGMPALLVAVTCAARLWARRPR
jgi:signal peptidase I